MHFPMRRRVGYSTNSSFFVPNNVEDKDWCGVIVFHGRYCKWSRSKEGEANKSSKMVKEPDQRRYESCYNEIDDLYLTYKSTLQSWQVKWIKN